MDPGQVLLCLGVIGASALLGLIVLFVVVPKRDTPSRWNWIGLGIALLGVALAFTLGLLKIANIAVVAIGSLYVGVFIASVFRSPISKVSGPSERPR